MKKFVRRSLLSLSAFVLIASNTNAQGISAYQLWRTPSYLRGFDYRFDQSCTQQDILNLKTAGATIIYLSTEGFLGMAAPYDTLQGNIVALDARVGYCDSAKVRYAIAVRRGPGRGDVYYQSINQDPPSTVWKDSNQQKLYGSMLRWMTSRYASDTLFIGITPTVEPNPFSDSLCCPDTTSMKEYFTRNGVDFTAIMQLWVDSIRAGSRSVPVLIQGPGYTNPDLFSLVPIVKDSFPVYEFHSYRPQFYAEDTTTNSVTYPGQYYNFVPFELVTFDKAFIKDTVFRFINQIARETGAPIFMGEFGLETQQIGGPQFLADISSIAIENGWEFAYWMQDNSYFDYNQWGGQYWSAVLASLDPVNSGVEESNPDSGELIISPSTNPGELSVYWPEADQSGLAMQVSIYDILGRHVRSMDETESHFLLELSGLRAGIYLLSLRSGQATAHALVRWIL